VAPSIQPAETLLARSDETVELLVDHPGVAVSAARFGGGAATPPPHVHMEHTEVFLVLDGALRFVAASGETVAGAGTVVVVSPGVTHTFSTDGEIRFLDFHAPSCGYGAFLRALTAAAGENGQARARASFDRHPAPAGGGGADPAPIAVVRTGGTDGEVVTDRPGRRVTLLADTEHLALTEFDYGPGQRGASPHVHHDHSDAFLVVEGELELTFESGPLRAPAGTFALVPPDVVHSFDNTSDASVRFFNVHAPSCGFGDYLRGRNPGFDQHEPPPGGGVDPASVVVRTFRTGG
jgi:mannose-6-phosphate isomerase-like protein (cupin superfamily)